MLYTLPRYRKKEKKILAAEKVSLYKLKVQNSLLIRQFERPVITHNNDYVNRRGRRMFYPQNEADSKTAMNNNTIILSFLKFIEIDGRNLIKK